jgi:hypothetical protein
VTVGKIQGIETMPIVPDDVAYLIHSAAKVYFKPFSEDDEIKMTGALHHLLIFLHLASQAARGKLGKIIVEIGQIL